MTSNMPREDRPGEAQPRDQRYERPGCLSYTTRNMMGRKGHPGGEVCVFPVLPVSRHLGLPPRPAPVTWPIVLALLRSVSLPATALCPQPYHHHSTCCLFYVSTCLLSLPFERQLWASGFKSGGSSPGPGGAD